MIGVGEVVRAKSRPDLGEIPIIEIYRGTVVVDIGLRIDGKMIGTNWPEKDLISLEDYPAYRKELRNRRRLQTQDSVQRNWNKIVRGAA